MVPQRRVCILHPFKNKELYPEDQFRVFVKRAQKLALINPAKQGRFAAFIRASSQAD